jgi:hypothetical protein
MKMISHLSQYLADLLLEWEIFQIKVAEKIKTRILCSATFSENCAVYDIMSNILVEPERRHIVWWIRVAWWISKAICAQALVAFPQQQWFRERALVSHYTYFGSLVILPLPEGQAGETWESFNKWCIIRSYKSVSLLSCCSLSSLYVCLLQLNGLGMWHLWGRVEIHTGH